MKKTMYLLIFGGILILTACGGGSATKNSSTDTPPLSTPPPADTSNEPTQPAASTASPEQQKMIDLSIENLTRKINVDVEKITVVKVTKVLWNDASLGCPKPGVDYIRVETPGYSIILESDGKTYEYHTDEIKRVTLCNSSQPKSINPLPGWRI